MSWLTYIMKCDCKKTEIKSHIRNGKLVRMESCVRCGAIIHIKSKQRAGMSGGEL